jgi:hypothetical protein
MQASNNVEKAREILLEGLENAQYSKPLLEVCSFSLSLSLYIYIYIYKPVLSRGAPGEVRP